VGSWRGSTLVSCLSGNEAHVDYAVAVDRYHARCALVELARQASLLYLTFCMKEGGGGQTLVCMVGYGLVALRDSWEDWFRPDFFCGWLWLVRF
jgi:hypothetical protein